VPIVAAHKVVFVVAVVTAFTALVVQVQIPAALGRAIDGSLSEGASAVVGSAVLIAVLGLGRWVLNLTSRTLLLSTAYRIEFDLRNLLYEHFLRLPFPFYDRVQSGELMSRANSDIRSVQMYLATAPVVLAQCTVAVVVFAQMMVVSVPLALVAMSTMPFVAIIGIHMRRRLFPVSWLVQARLADVATVVDESINGVRVVKSFAAETQQLRALSLAATRTRWTVERDAGIRARWGPLVENLPRLGQALILLFGGWMVLQRSISLGTVVAFNAYVLLLQPPFRMLGMIMMMGQRARASAQRIYAILDTEPEIADPPDALVLDPVRGDVRLDGVSFSYRAGTPVLRDIDLHVRPGETVALVGRSGSGKSTLARLLARGYDVDEGAVLIDGHDVRSLALGPLRRQVAMVLDEPFLFSTSIRDNIAFARPDVPDDVVRAAARAAGAERFIMQLGEGFDTVVGERGYSLSGGQRQRIAIARALVADAPVLVLDDATSAVDAPLEAQILRWIRHEMPARTMILIGHRASTIRLADRVVLLEEGRIVAEGTHEDLLAGEPRYADLLIRQELERPDDGAALALDALELADLDGERSVNS
jgi:ATP-binding cassette subfamily B protein